VLKVEEVKFPFGEPTRKRDKKAEKKDPKRSELQKVISQEANSSEDKIREIAVSQIAKLKESEPLL